MRWTDWPARKAALSLASSASQATTWASAPARSASTTTMPGSGTNIRRMFGSLKSCASVSVGSAPEGRREYELLAEGASDNWGEDELGNAVLVGDIVGLVASIIQHDVQGAGVIWINNS